MYANDCIEIKDRAKRRQLKRIERHTDDELNAVIEQAFRRFGEDFYLMLHGIDAYMERRKRRKQIFHHVFGDDEPPFDNEGIWGNS